MTEKTLSTNSQPLIAGVCGDPIFHSKSPRLFKHWFETYQLNGYYVPLHVRADRFADVLHALPQMGFQGVNVTLPHKETALAVAHETSPAAAAIKAANTLSFHTDGTIYADNTDGFGFLENLKAGAPDWSAADGPAVLLGSGGAARAAVHALLAAGCPELRLTNRTRERAERLADDFGDRVKVVDWQEREDCLQDANLVANTTSLGMVGNAPLELRLDAAPDDAVVTDMVYNPLETDLLSSARARGLHAVDGLGMLLHQARPGCNRWFGVDPEVTPALRHACLASDS